MSNKVSKHQLDFFELLSGMFIFLIILLILAISFTSKQNLFFVLIGLFPTIFIIIISMLIHEHYANYRSALWLIPIVVVGIFYFMGHSTAFFNTQFDVDLLSGVNFILSVIYMLIVFSVFLNDFKEKLIVQQDKKVIAKKSLQEYIHSIEDKSKALNFAIGRVYSKYHGGSKEIREKLRIPSDWYNEFSLIGVGTQKIDYVKLEELITRFELQLKQFEKTEFELFKEKSNNLKNLIREVKGTDKIIDVLDHNDKDPVKSYYKGALEFCKMVKEEIKNKNLKIVRNEYIPKDEEDLAKITNKPTTVSKNSEKSQKNVEIKSISKSVSKNSNKKSSSKEPKPPFTHP